VDTITVDLEQYVNLLLKARCTDPAQWPEGYREGANHMRRIIEIEQQCKAEHGQWDWEQLSAALQNEYDAECAMLDDLRDSLNPQPSTDFREWMREQGLVTE
jgi:hypothetical protein